MINKSDINWNTLTRFFNKFDFTDSSVCWDWQASKNKQGYGRFSVDNKLMYAHRFSYTIHNGEIPENLFVMHTCDNPSCVNPRHLKVGTHQDNMDDKCAKNRQARMFGEDNPASKLTTEQVHDIRTKRIAGVEFAELYGVDKSQISRIQNNLKWVNA